MIATPKQIRAAVAEAYDLTPEALSSKYRVAKIADARAVAMWIMREYGYTYEGIGREFNRDHTSAMTAKKKIDRFIKSGQAVEKILGGLNG